MYADDILLIASSVSELQRLFHACEFELSCINTKKSCCIRTGPRCDVKCASISTMKGHNLPWVSEIRYLGTYYIIKGRQFRCSVANAKRSFNRSTNAIFGKLGRIASEEVTLQLVKSKCLPILLYGLECYSLLKADLHPLTLWS